MSNETKEAIRSSVAGQQNSSPLVTSLKLALLRRVEVQQKAKLSRSALYAKLNPKDAAYDPDWPVPIRVGANSVRWIESEVDAYIASRPRTRNTDGGAK